MKIISHNIEFGKSTTAEAAARALKSLQPDVILFNEVPGDGWTARVGVELGMPHNYCGKISSADHLDKYKSILSRTPLLHTREILVEGKGWNPISVVRAETEVEGTTVALYALHIPGHVEREGSACEFLAREIITGEPCENVIAGGDYNNRPEDDALTAMLDAGFRSMWHLLDIDTTLLFTHNAMNPKQRTGVIDHFFVRSGGGLSIVAGGMVELDVPLSDHKPIWTELASVHAKRLHGAALCRTDPMTAKQRVTAAMDFRETDRVPRMFTSFEQNFLRSWRERHGDLRPQQFSDSDMSVVAANETAWPTRAGVVEERAGVRISRNGWGWLERRTAGTSFAEMFDRALDGRTDPDTLVFDDPLLDMRYESARRTFDASRDRLYVMCKTGGPYLRVAMMRGEEEFWLDIADDPGWVKAIVDRLTDHMIAVGVESIRRFSCQDTGIAIYDDCAANWGPFMSPDAYERLFLPALRRMVEAYKAAGAAKVMFHSDGNVLPLLDMWVDAGIDAINPIEYRLGMDPVKLREKYGRRLACVGGLCNTEILPRGDRAELRDHVQHLFEAASGGGFVMGTASISGDVSVSTFEYLVELLDELDPYR